ncbi:MAG: hypothetical protein JOZ73_02740, partial [Solirubrobacterales bacterium]|nr:hypothetical protein [Solirubrobacterales bacterium]
MRMLHPARKLAALTMLLVAASLVFIAPAQARHRSKVKVKALGWCGANANDQTPTCVGPGGTISRCASTGPIQVIFARYTIKRGKVRIYKRVLSGPGFRHSDRHKAAPAHKSAFTTFAATAFPGGGYTFKMVVKG